MRCIARTTWHTGGMPSTGGLRARVRAELMQEIKDEARRQMAQEGASSLSLRAIARHLDMVSSGIYRYFKSRDELLTALIVDAYEAIGSAVETADGRCERADFAGRWSACCHAVRDWALAHPHEYALIYGSPVPGYHAPEETNPPASRVALTLVAIIHDAAAAGELRGPLSPRCLRHCPRVPRLRRLGWRRSGSTVWPMTPSFVRWRHGRSSSGR